MTKAIKRTKGGRLSLFLNKISIQPTDFSSVRYHGPACMWDIISVFLILAITVLMCLDCKYGTGIAVDEAFYLAVPKRLLAGDGLFTDEWHLSQLSALLTLPLVKLWYLFHDNSEGMYLTFCYIFCIFQGIMGGAVYALLRKYKGIALLSAVTVMQCIILNFKGLSYNTMGLAFALMLMCLTLRNCKKPSIANTIFSGVFYACLILCNPITIFLFPLYVTAVLVCFLRRKKAEAPHELLNVKYFICFVCGILPVFIYFLCILLKNSSISDIIASVPYILSDPEHMQLADGTGVQTFSLSAFFGAITKYTGVVPFVLCIALCVAGYFTALKNRLAGVLVSLAGCTQLLVFGIIHLFADNELREFGIAMFPFLFFAATLCFICGGRLKPVFRIFILGGVFYALCMQFTSNLDFDAQINGYISAMPGVFIIIYESLHSLSSRIEKKFAKRIVPCSVALIPALACVFYIVGSVFFLRGGFVKSDESVKFKQGFYSGKYESSDVVRHYTGLTSDIKELDKLAAEGDRLLVIANLPSAYLETDKMKSAVMSEWFNPLINLGNDEARERFFAYYDINPDNLPDYIYLPAFEIADDKLNVTYPKKKIEYYVTPYFEGEKIKLASGYAFRVEGLKETNENNN